MKIVWKSLGVLALALCAVSASANEARTLELATDTVQVVSGLALKGMPPALLREAAGIAIIPHVTKVGLVLDERHGHGVVLVREPDGRWSHPYFITLSGRGIGLQAGIESTDLVLVFKTRQAVDRVLRGKLTLGHDASVAAGPLGHEVDRATTGSLFRTDVLSYSRSRGLFAGVALEGDVLRPDLHANEAYYGLKYCRPDEVLTRPGAGQPAVERLRGELIRLGGVPQPAVVVQPRKR